MLNKDVDRMLGKSWAIVSNDGPTFSQHSDNVLCLLDKVCLSVIQKASHIKVVIMFVQPHRR